MTNKLSVATKLLYGLGFTSQGIKDGLFQIFLFFYFSQILGLDPALTGVSTLIALAFDAISDPLIGSWSDNMKSGKWGRRHPWMFASAIPVGLSIYLLFLPPAGLSEMGLFWWLTIFTILVRVSLTLFIVPGMSLGAELSEDYEERTSITTFRIAFGAFIAPIVLIIGYTSFFIPTEEYSNGLLNASAYPRFAFFCANLIIISVLISTWSTKRFIPDLPKAAANQKTSLGSIITGLKGALKLQSYRTVVGYIMTLYIAIGIGTTMTTYFMTYYFDLDAAEQAVLPIATALAAFLSFIVSPKLTKIWDKRKTVMISTAIFAVCFGAPYFLRIFGFFPSNDSELLIPFYFVAILVAYLFVWTALSAANSMMADVVDESELETGIREEGLFFSTMSFAYKCTVGFGYLFAGLLLKWIAFPSQTALADIPQSAIDGLGWIGGYLLLGIYLLSLIFIRNYPIDKERYEEIRGQLKAR